MHLVLLTVKLHALLCCSMLVENMGYHRGPMNQRWPQDRYEFRGGYRGRGPPPFRGGGGQRGGWYPRGSGEYGDRSRRYTRSSSRSHSRSVSPRSRSRSITRSSDDRGSRSRSDDSRGATRKRRVSLASVWNSLNTDTLCCSCLALFKRNLKTFLFRQTFRPSSSCITRL